MEKLNTEFEEKIGKTVFFVDAMTSEDAKEMPDKKLLKLMIDELFAENEKITS